MAGAYRDLLDGDLTDDQRARVEDAHCWHFASVDPDRPDYCSD